LDSLPASAALPRNFCAYRQLARRSPAANSQNAHGTSLAIPAPMTQLQTRLAKDHAEIHALLECLAQDVDAPPCGALAATWAELEARLLRHMDTEELYLLPLLEASHPAEVEHTRADHARIRELVAELGVAIELHTVRKPAVMQLVELLQRHAAHEDAALYDLAGARASVSIERRVFAALKGTVQSALGASGRATRSSPGSRPLS
jgi:hypothetical protein